MLKVPAHGFMCYNSREAKPEKVDSSANERPASVQDYTLALTSQVFNFVC